MNTSHTLPPVEYILPQLRGTMGYQNLAYLVQAKQPFSPNSTEHVRGFMREKVPSSSHSFTVDASKLVIASMQADTWGGEGAYPIYRALRELFQPEVRYSAAGLIFPMDETGLSVVLLGILGHPQEAEIRRLKLIIEKAPAVVEVGDTLKGAQVNAQLTVIVVGSPRTTRLTLCTSLLEQGIATTLSLRE